MAEQGDVTERQLRMMRHAVSKKWHRNHYVAAKGTEDDHEWTLLEKLGLAREFRDGICVRTWHVTEKGVQFLKEMTDG